MCTAAHSAGNVLILGFFFCRLTMVMVHDLELVLEKPEILEHSILL